MWKGDPSPGPEQSAPMKGVPAHRGKLELGISKVTHLQPSPVCGSVI